MVIVIALLCLGALMVFSAGANVDGTLDVGQADGQRHWQQLLSRTTIKRLLFVPVAWGVLALVGRLNYRRWVVNIERFWRSPIVWLLGLGLLLCVLVLIPGVGAEKNYSRRWLELNVAGASVGFQPSELAKWSVVMFAGAYCCYQGERLREFWRGFVPIAVVLGVVVGLIGVEDFGTAALVGAVTVMVLAVGGVRWRHLSLLIPAAAAAFYVLVYCNEHRWGRVLAHLDSGGGSDMAYQGQQSIMAIGAGGLWGRGLGMGTVKLGWLPEDTTDFVFAVIGEELGFVGCALVIALFAGFLLCSLLIVLGTPDKLGRMLGIAVAGTVGAQAVMNLAVVVGLAPTKGIALPFVSAGGSGLVMAAAATGVLINISRHRIDRPIVSAAGQVATDKHKPSWG